MCSRSKAIPWCLSVCICVSAKMFLAGWLRGLQTSHLMQPINILLWNISVPDAIQGNFPNIVPFRNCTWPFCVLTIRQKDLQRGWIWSPDWTGLQDSPKLPQNTSLSAGEKLNKLIHSLKLFAWLLWHLPGVSGSQMSRAYLKSFNNE